MEGLLPVDYGTGYEMAIEGCQFAIVSAGQGKEIAIGYLRGVEQVSHVDVLLIEQRDVVRPELMSRKCTQLPDQFSCGRWRTRRVRIACVSDDSQNTILCKRACGPGLPTLCREPLMGALVLYVSRVDQGDKHIDVEQKPDHVSSSLSCFTNSVVTGTPRDDT